LPRGDAPGSKPSPILIPSGWSSSMRPARRRKWPASGAGRSAVCGAAHPSLTVTGRRRPSQALCV
jgi:hypothetical protein